MYCFPRTYVCMCDRLFYHKIGSTAYVLLSANVRVYFVHFRYKNAYNLECVNYLGYCQEFRWIFIHYGIDIASAVHV